MPNRNPRWMLVRKFGASGYRRRTTTRYWLAAGLVLLVEIAFVILVGGQALGYFDGAKYFAVPKILHDSASMAERQLTADGLRWSATQVRATEIDSGQVLSQQPSFPTLVRRGDLVRFKAASLVPTKGPSAVPSVVGMQEKMAESTLKHAGFKWKVRNVSPTQVQNQVIEQSPDVSAQKPKGSTVTIWVVKIKTIDVPSLANDNGLQAGVVLAKAGFNVGTVARQFSPTVTIGNVISSDPAVGTSVAPGTAVNLIISEGSGVTVPYLFGDSERQAVSALTRLGLVPLKGAPIGTEVQGFVGNVAAQQTVGASAGPGDEVARGTTIRYRIGVATGSPTITTTTTTLPASPVTSTSLSVIGGG